jgi:hypothetical protein
MFHSAIPFLFASLLTGVVGVAQQGPGSRSGVGDQSDASLAGPSATFAGLESGHKMRNRQSWSDTTLPR